MGTQQAELFVLLEAALGFVLVRVQEWDAIAQDLDNVQESLLEPGRFSQVVRISGIYAFANAEEAVANCQAIAAGESTETLRNFLEQNLPRKKKKYQLGILDPALGKDLAGHDFSVLYDKNILELTRICRFHFKRLLKGFGYDNIQQFQVGLGHSYSRTKIKTDPNRQDKPVQNAVAVLEILDKTVNTFAMRVKEWYCWHFPELGKIVTDNVKFAEVVRLIRVKEDFSDERLPELVAVLDGDESMAEEILAARNISMGTDIVEIDMINIDRFAHEVITLAQQRRRLAEYLGRKLGIVAPNLQTLIGDILAAKLIAHAGSLTNLAKYPASTVQILGAEKALFRALKTRGNTPKYGLLFQSSFIGRAAPKHKGRVSRYLANKCSMASRIDNFAIIPSNIFGLQMRDQVEERLNYLVQGTATRKNMDVMKAATMQYEEKVAEVEKDLRKKAKKEKKARKLAAAVGHTEEATEAPDVQDEHERKEKRDKKRQRADSDGELPIKKHKSDKKKKRKSSVL